MWQAQETAAALADAYREAAIAGANMRQVADSLETLREAILKADRPFRPWEAIDDQIGEAFGQPDLPTLLSLRARFIERLIADELKSVSEALAADREAGTRTYLAALAEAITEWRHELYEKLAAAKLDLAPELREAAATVRTGVPLLRQLRWADLYPLFRTLADAEFVPPLGRARLYSIAGEIQLYHFPGGNSADELIERALELAPDDPAVLTAKGEFHQQRGDVQAAREWARRALAVKPRYGVAHCLLGDCSKRLEAYEEAEEYYREAIRVRPGDTLPYLRLIQLTGEPSAGRRLERISELVERARTLEPRSGHEFLVEAGNACEKRGATDEALQWYERAIDSAPDFLNGHVFKAYLLRYQGDRDGARASFEQVIELAADFHDGYWGLALLAEEADDLGGAEQWYRKGAERASQWSARFRVRAGLLAWRRERSPESEERLLASAAASFDDEIVLDTVERVADFLRSGGDFAGAVAFCERIRKAVGDAYEGRFAKKLGDLSSAEGDYAEAAKHHRAAVAAEPDEATHYADLARALRLQRDWAGARGLYESAPARVQANKSFRREMALLRNGEAIELYSAGRYSESVTLYEEAIEHDPDDDVLYSNLASACELDAMRESLLGTYGVLVPGIRVRGNEGDMPPGSYLIMLSEVPLVMGTVAHDKRLATAPMEKLRARGFDPEPAANPQTGEEAAWLIESDWERAEQEGLELWSVIEYAARHLQAVLEVNLIEFLGHQEVRNLLENESSEIARGLLERPEALTPLTAVLRGLLAELVPITDFAPILARFVELLDTGRTPVDIVEELRLIPEVRPKLPGNHAGTSFFALDDAFEAVVGGSLHRDGEHVVLAMVPEICQETLGAVRNQVGNRAGAALLVNDPATRPFARKLFELEFPRLAVLSRRELLPELESELAGVVRLEPEKVG